MLFAKRARPGDPIGLWSWFMPLDWERAVRAESFWKELSDFNFLMQSFWPQALMRVNATNEPATTEEQLFTQSLGLKIQMAE